MGDALAESMTHAARHLVRRLDQHGGLAAEQRQALVAALSPPQRVAAGESLVIEGDRVDGLMVLLSGLVLVSRRLGDGRQQHLAMQTSGDILDHTGFVLSRATASVTALCVSLVACIPRAKLEAVLSEHLDLGARVQREVAISALIAQEWMVNIGRRSALGRMAHFLCEVDLRLEDPALRDCRGVRLPLTQTDLADIMGLSVVHTNRVIQQLRRDKLIELSQGRLRVLDREELARTGGFDGGYLNPKASA